MSGYLWFEYCELYLTRLETLDAYFTLCDTLPTGTKKEKELKRVAFDNLMMTIKQKKDIEDELDEIWPNQGVSPLP